MIRTALLLAALVFPAAPAWSWMPEEAEPGDVAALEACTAAHLPAFAEAEARCIGSISEPCMGTPEGGTTIGMTACLHREQLAWDVILNADWPKLRALAKRIDEDQAVEGMTLPSYAETLLTAQRAWLAWREAECMNQAAEWGIGSHGRVVHAACFMQMTGERTLLLRARLTDGER
ncbi:hypothetical protein LNKW23_05830 [Paralimibaculum aggregatum]|uniref:Lysozyme inhibitor LprI-like N-terminal domain-containing protein n=1 Tax=Paralimibaculum aggregatum TaxID=3036245 RepID=A0ABQ6LM54_9RHOB|nr:lysozyme inhibitor LprI family protein [Limibaculum sp. NKW23]GMG81370.1 hypothetical protein LNKW23_05830 [Limibaculum sp. NKW23]